MCNSVSRSSEDKSPSPPTPGVSAAAADQNWSKLAVVFFIVYLLLEMLKMLKS